MSPSIVIPSNKI
ncbi:hypothetical protein N499_0486A, partial [Wolbachia pipientis wVitA]